VGCFGAALYIFREYSGLFPSNPLKIEGCIGDALRLR